MHRLIRVLLPAIVAFTAQAGKWKIENSRLAVTVDSDAGTLSVRDKVARQDWTQAPATPFTNVKTEKRAIAFDTGALRVKLTLSGSEPDLFVEADMVDRATKIENIPFLAPFALDSHDGALLIADYSNGHLYPLDMKPFPRRQFQLGSIDMPWLGVVDLRSGAGYAIVAETPDDCIFEMVTVGANSAPRVVWTPSKGEFRYPRRMFYHFSSRGGYVPLAKRYRTYAKQNGMLVPFSEKLKKNPNIARLFGAPDVWGNPSLKFAQEAKQAGVAKMLIHTSPSVARRTGITPEEMKAINELGYLSSTYDNYTDVFALEPGKQIDETHDRVPENVVLRADGTRMPAWLTWDKKQFMKRCPAVFIPAAKAVIPKDLSIFPYLGRFIDVTTAESLYECFDDNHPLTRTSKRETNVEFLSYVRSLNLVTGGEHGRWWAVPQLDYIEGMMSGGSYSWPAGYLRRPKSKDQEFTEPSGRKLPKWSEYEKWGIGHQGRVPLWELVFHEGIVTTWYWGDSNDFLLEAAPEITPRKDAFNILYGTMPMLWANKQGSWESARDVFLRTYRNTCKLHEAVAGTEMVSHEFVTPDRAVQRTRFSDGTQVIVNFGEAPYKAELGGRSYLLPASGFAVKGPRIEQSLALVNGRPVTTIRAPGFEYTDAK
jgi:hypothetical protein